MSAARSVMQRVSRILQLLLLLTLLVPVSLSSALAQASGERVLAIYLPGVYFSQVERKLELGNELAAHLSQALGERYRLNARVYGTEEAMAADASRIALALCESPFVATKLQQLLPVSVAAVGSSLDTRLMILAGGAATAGLSELRKGTLTYASPMEPSQAFFDNFVFEGELPLPKESMLPTRDVASALSLLSLRKADAVMLYEDDVAVAKQSGLRVLYQSDRLPRPTLVLFDRKTDAAEVARLRDALSQFKGQVHPSLRAFRNTTDAPYQALRARISTKQKRGPVLLELIEESNQLPSPKPPLNYTSPIPPKTFAPLD
ncbi:MAG TPA: hypothetical protein PLA87_12075 [Pseudomonadota bacterium]|jgi:hypothetical protein|nr:hypothetical protein [Pseudomonadota bacterium]